MTGAPLASQPAAASVVSSSLASARHDMRSPCSKDDVVMTLTSLPSAVSMTTRFGLMNSGLHFYEHPSVRLSTIRCAELGMKFVEDLSALGPWTITTSRQKV